MEFNEFDNKFIGNLLEIINNGTEYESRAVWDDGIPAKCKKIFGVVNRYNSDLSNTPPIGAIRKLAIKNCIDELLWIWQKKSNNVHDLKSHVWDQWADENGSIGAAYGFQVASKLRKAHHNTIENRGESNEYVKHYDLFLDQTDYVLHELKYNPFNRRIITDLYSVGDTSLMGLDPCCYSCTWNVTEKDGNRYLNLLLNQRSQDMVVANNWNVFQYWMLQNLFAAETGLEVGELVHIIADCHIYDRHFKIAKDMIREYMKHQSDPTKNKISYPDIKINFKGFYNTGLDDIDIVGEYKYISDVKKIPVAV